MTHSHLSSLFSFESCESHIILLEMAITSRFCKMTPREKSSWPTLPQSMSELRQPVKGQFPILTYSLLCAIKTKYFPGVA